jgi:acyl-CoA thioester hydrolase
VRHLYRCPVRWADLDAIGHVNNVTYVDYLQEARVDLFRTHAPDTRADDLAEGVVVVRHEVHYVSSLTFRPAPVSIETWVTDVRAGSFTLAYEVFDEDEAGERTVYLRASSVLAPYVFLTESPRRLTAQEREVLETLRDDAGDEAGAGAPRWTEPVEMPGGRYPVHVRFSDVDLYRHVNNVTYFEYFQEARIAMMLAQDVEQAAGMHLVVARTDVQYRRPLVLREQPYDCTTWITGVGRTSVVLESVITDGDAEMARCRVVGVCLDSATARPTPVPEAFRAMADSA